MGPTSKGRGRDGKRGEWRGKGNGEEKREGKGRGEGKGGEEKGKEGKEDSLLVLLVLQLWS